VYILCHCVCARVQLTQPRVVSVHYFICTLCLSGHLAFIAARRPDLRPFGIDRKQTNYVLAACISFANSYPLPTAATPRLTTAAPFHLLQIRCRTTAAGRRRLRNYRAARQTHRGWPQLQLRTGHVPQDSAAKRGHD